MNIKVIRGKVSSLSTTIVPSQGYYLPNTISVNKVVTTSPTYNNQTGAVNISNMPQGLQINATATATQTTFAVNVDGVNKGSFSVGAILEVTESGLYNTTEQAIVWTYTSTNRFVGFATTSGGAIAYRIGDIITLNATINLYSLDQQPACTINLSSLGITESGAYRIAVQASDANSVYPKSYISNEILYVRYAVNMQLSNCTSNAPTSVESGANLTINLTAASGYTLPNSIKINGTSVSSTGGEGGMTYIYSKSNGTIIFNGIDRNINIQVDGVV